MKVLVLNFKCTNVLISDLWIWILFYVGHTLLLKIAELVPRHPGRTGKAKTPAAITSGASGSGGGKKGGKKKK